MDETQDVRFAAGLAGGLVLLPALAFVIGQAVLLGGGRIGPVTGWICCLGALLGSVAFSWRSTRAWSAPALVSGVLMLASVSGLLILDRSYDGQGYQFDAIYAIARGWNPIAREVLVTDLTPLNDNVSPWPYFYPTAGWVSSAVQVAAGAPLEMAKNQGLVLAVAALCGAYAAGRALGMNRTVSGLAAVLIAANPVAIVQLFSRMNDGQLFDAFLTTGALAVVWLKTANRWALAGALAAMAYGLNLKFSAVLMFGALCALIVSGVVLAKGWRRGLHAAIPLALGAVISLGVVGFHPYVDNLRDFGHPFYPVRGKGARDIITMNRPVAFNHMGWGQRLAASYLGPTSVFDPAPRPRAPFAVTRAEFTAAGEYDARSGGFGPLFSVALILAVPLAAVVGLRGRRDTRVLGLLGAAGGLLGLCLVMPENWWARYVSELWLVPAIIAVAGLVVKQRGVGVASSILCLVLVIDAGAVACVSAYRGLAESRWIRRQITELAASPGPVCAYVGKSHARAVLLRQGAPKATIQPEPLPGQGTLLLRAYATAPAVAAYGACRQITPSAAKASISSAANP